MRGTTQGPTTRWRKLATSGASPTNVPIPNRDNTCLVGNQPKYRKSGNSATQAFGQYRYFGGFRLILALLVASQHFFANVAPVEMGIWANPYSLGANAVLVFFALSGFVIYEAADAVYGRKPVPFLLNRLLRITPQFVSTLGISIALYAIFDWVGVLKVARDGVWPGAHNALAVQNIGWNFISYLPLGDRYITYNFLPIAWALRVEMTFYFFIAAALVLMRLTVGRMRAGLSLDAASFILFSVALPLFVLAVMGKAPTMFQFTPYFTFGGALYVSSIRQNRIAGLLSVLSLSGIIAQFVTNHHMGWTLDLERSVAAQLSLLLSLLAVMILLITARGGAIERVDRWLGDLTFPLYLSHSYVSLAFQSLTPCDSYTILIAAFATSLVIAIASRGLIDPTINRLRNVVRARALDRVETITTQIAETGQSAPPPFRGQ